MYLYLCTFECITPLYHSQCNPNRDHPSTGRMERIEKWLSLAQLKRTCSFGKTNNLGKDPQIFILYCPWLIITSCGVYQLESQRNGKSGDEKR